MSIPPLPEHGAPSTARQPDRAADAPDDSSRRKARRGFIIALSIGCVVMLSATAVLAVTTLTLARHTASAPATPTPAPTSTAEDVNPVQSARGIEITTRTDLAVGDYALSDTLEDIYTYIVAPVSWDDEQSGVDLSFDVTAYDGDGRILDRRPAHMYLLPGQEGFFIGLLTVDLDDIARMSVEQTRAKVDVPIMTGAISLTRTETLEKSTDEGDKVYVAGAFTSTLGAVPRYPEVHFAGFVDDQLVGFCSDEPDIPSGGEFTSVCALTPVTSEDEQTLDGTLPKGTEFRAYLELDAISEGR